MHGSTYDSLMPLNNGDCYLGHLLNPTLCQAQSRIIRIVTHPYHIALLHTPQASSDSALHFPWILRGRDLPLSNTPGAICFDTRTVPTPPTP